MRADSWGELPQASMRMSVWPTGRITSADHVAPVEVGLSPALRVVSGLPLPHGEGCGFWSACQWLLRLRALPTLSAGAYIYPYNDKDDKPVLPDEAPRENAGDGGAFSRGCRGHRPLEGLRLLAHRCTVSEATTCRAPAPTRQVVAVDAGRAERRGRRCRMRSR